VTAQVIVNLLAEAVLCQDPGVFGHLGIVIDEPRIDVRPRRTGAALPGRQGNARVFLGLGSRLQPKDPALRLMDGLAECLRGRIVIGAVHTFQETSFPKRVRYSALAGSRPLRKPGLGDFRARRMTR
jgi:hypothetical protein